MVHLPINIEHDADSNVDSLSLLIFLIGFLFVSALIREDFPLP